MDCIKEDNPIEERLTLRDQIALAAREEDLRPFYYLNRNQSYTREEAKYRYADAMLEARKKIL